MLPAFGPAHDEQPTSRGSRRARRRPPPRPGRRVATGWNVMVVFSAGRLERPPRTTSRSSGPAGCGARSCCRTSPTRLHRSTSVQVETARRLSRPGGLVARWRPSGRRPRPGRPARRRRSSPRRTDRSFRRSGCRLERRRSTATTVPATGRRCRRRTWSTRPRPSDPWPRPGTDLGHLDVDHVAQRVLGVVGDARPSPGPSSRTHSWSEE